jgi:lysyl endopeptidase
VTRPQGRYCDIGAYEVIPIYIITGNVGIAGTILTYTDGTSQFVTVDGSGNYSINVPFGWSGTVTPHKIGYSFTPASKTYTNVQNNQGGQDYTAAVCATCADTDTTGVFRPGNGVIFLKNTNATGFADVALNYGLPGDQPVTGDWNGDGIDTIGVYRNGQFLLRNSNTIGFADIVFGLGESG